MRCRQWPAASGGVWALPHISADKHQSVPARAACTALWLGDGGFPGPRRHHWPGRWCRGQSALAQWEKRQLKNKVPQSLKKIGSLSFFKHDKRGIVAHCATIALEYSHVKYANFYINYTYPHLHYPWAYFVWVWSHSYAGSSPAFVHDWRWRVLEQGHHIS